MSERLKNVRRHAAVVLLAWAAMGGAPDVDPLLRKVPVEPIPSAAVDGRRGGLLGLFSRRSKRACVDVARIAGAVVTDARTIELRLRDGERWRMRFRDDCPALSYYQGFYYRRSQPSQLCAGRDAIVARSGGGCVIDSLARAKLPR